MEHLIQSLVHALASSHDHAALLLMAKLRLWLHLTLFSVLCVMA